MRNDKTITVGSDLDTMLKTKMPAAGVDIGGTKMMAAVINAEGLLTEPVVISTPLGPENILQAITSLVEEFKKTNVIAGVGISTAGIVDGNTGTILGATGNLPGWTGTEVKKIIESKTLLPVHVENDGNAAAYAEAHTKHLKGKTCVISLTIGTGIGGGILIDGKVFHGANHGAGHCGHIKLALDNKRLCTCGLFDCYEAYASGIGLLNTAKEILSTVSVEQSLLAKDLASLKNSDIFTAAGKGDLVAKEIIATWHKHLAAGMATLANALNPDCFVLGGGLGPLIDLSLITELVLDLTLPKIGERLEIYKSELGNQAGMIGAAQLILDKLAKST